MAISLIHQEEVREVSLPEYEARIQMYKEQIGTGYIGIGRTLNEAKESGKISHGEWEGWVERVTGLTIRQAQRCMQAAREIREGSELARLEMSKALALLSSGLEEEQRENLARKSAEEGGSLKELREEIRQLKLKAVQEAGAAVEIREALKKAEAEKNSLAQQMRDTVSAYRQRMEEAEEEAYRRGMTDQADRSEAELQALQHRIDEQEDETQRLLRRCDEEAREEEREKLRKELESAKRRADDQNAAGRKMMQERDELRRNQADLLAAAEEAEKRAADAEAELEALKAGGAGRPEPVWKILKVAAERFMADCEMLPYSGVADLMIEENRIDAVLELIEGWTREMRNALAGAVPAEGAVI